MHRPSRVSEGLGRSTVNGMVALEDSDPEAENLDVSLLLVAAPVFLAAHYRHISMSLIGSDRGGRLPGDVGPRTPVPALPSSDI